MTVSSDRRTRRRTTRLTAATGLAVAVWAASMAPAWAHVTVVGPGATQGGYAVLTFRVPTEKANASTVGLTVQLPADTPLASVSIEAQPGWTYTAPQTTLATPITTDDGPVDQAVTQIDWTATAGGIAPGQFGQFNISVGPLPHKPTIMFKALQKYSDGSEVDWIETPAAGSNTEPEHPAPTLALAAADTSSADAANTAASAANGAPAAASPSAVTVAAADTAGDTASKGSATTGIVLGAIGTVLGAAALLLAVLRTRRPRRPDAA